MSLDTVIRQLRGLPDFELYVNYLENRQQGLRKAALTILEQFIEEACNWDFQRRLVVTRTIMQCSEQSVDTTKLLPDNLRRQFLVPTLDEWTLSEPNNPLPLRWRGKDANDYREAIRVDPAEKISRRRLADILLREVEYATHELPWGYLGDAKSDLARLDEVDAMIATLSENDRNAFATRSHSLRERVQAYTDYLASGVRCDFGDWLRIQGRTLK